MSDGRGNNGAITGDWDAWEAKALPTRQVTGVTTSGGGGSEVTHTFLKHIRHMGVHATEVMLRELGTSPADHHKYKCPKVASYCAHHTMKVLQGHLTEAKVLFAQEERRNAELERRQQLAADTVAQATKEAVRKVKNAKRNAKKRAAKRRIKIDKMKTEMNDKLELAKTKRKDCENIMKKGLQHTVEGRKLMLKWSSDATDLTMEAAELSAKVLAATNAEVARELPHMKSIVDPPPPEFVADNGSDLSDWDPVEWEREDTEAEMAETAAYMEANMTWTGTDMNNFRHLGGIDTMGGARNSTAGVTIPVTVHGGQSGGSRSQKRNAMKRLKKRIAKEAGGL